MRPQFLAALWKAFQKTPQEKIKERVLSLKQTHMTDHHRPENYALMIVPFLFGSDSRDFDTQNFLLSEVLDACKEAEIEQPIHSSIIYWYALGFIIDDDKQTNTALMQDIIKSQPKESLLKTLAFPNLYKEDIPTPNKEFLMGLFKDILNKTEPENAAYVLKSALISNNMDADDNKEKFQALHSAQIQRLIEAGETSKAIKTVFSSLEPGLISIHTVHGLPVEGSLDTEYKIKLFKDFLVPLIKNDKNAGVSLTLLARKHGLDIPELEEQFKEEADNTSEVCEIFRRQAQKEITEIECSLKTAKLELKDILDPNDIPSLGGAFIYAIEKQGNVIATDEQAQSQSANQAFQKNM